MSYQEIRNFDQLCILAENPQIIGNINTLVGRLKKNGIFLETSDDNGECIELDAKMINHFENSIHSILWWGCVFGMIPFEYPHRETRITNDGDVEDIEDEDEFTLPTVSHPGMINIKLNYNPQLNTYDGTLRNLKNSKLNGSVYIRSPPLRVRSNRNRNKNSLSNSTFNMDNNVLIPRTPIYPILLDMLKLNTLEQRNLDIVDHNYFSSKYPFFKNELPNGSLAKDGMASLLKVHTMDAQADNANFIKYSEYSTVSLQSIFINPYVSVSHDEEKYKLLNREREKKNKDQLFKKGLKDCGVCVKPIWQPQVAPAYTMMDYFNTKIKTSIDDIFGVVSRALKSGVSGNIQMELDLLKHSTRYFKDMIEDTLTYIFAHALKVNTQNPPFKVRVKFDLGQSIEVVDEAGESMEVEETVQKKTIRSLTPLETLNPIENNDLLETLETDHDEM